MRIYLSPSSQFDNAYSGVTAVEGSVCNDIAIYCEKALKRCGIEVKRGDSTKTTMESRVSESNDWHADYHIPIHTNAGGGKGTEVYAWPTTIDSVVKAVYNNVAKLSPGADRGIKDGSGLYEVNSTNAICCYIECEFHDTYGKWIYEHKKDLGEAIAKGICEGAGVKYVLETPETNTNEKMYRVQVGAFKYKKNAENLAKELNKAGYDTIIK